MIELLSIATTVFFGITTLILTNKLTKRKSLAYEILVESSLVRMIGQIKESFKTIYRQEEARNIYLLLIGIINNGNMQISKEDFKKPISFEFNSHARILDVEIENSEPRKLPVQVDPISGNKVAVILDLMNPREWFILKFLVAEYESFDVGSQIIEMGKIGEYRPFSLYHYLKMEVTLIIACFLCFLILESFIGSYPYGDVLVGGLIIALFLGITIGFLLERLLLKPLDKDMKYYVNRRQYLTHQIGDPEIMSYLLLGLGWAAIGKEHFKVAKRYFQQGMDLARKLGNTKIMIDLLLWLGWTASNRGEYKEAADYLKEGLDLACEIKHTRGISAILNNWGEVYFKQQELDSATEAFLKALRIAQDWGSQEMAAIALYGLARIAAVRGKNITAHRQGQESLNIFEAIGHNKVDEVKQWLIELSLEV